MLNRILPLLLLLIAGVTTRAHAEVLVRWTQDDVPGRLQLGVPALVIPATNTRALREARAQGYLIYLEVDASKLAAFVPPADAPAGVVVKGGVSSRQLLLLESKLPRAVPVISLEERGKWPHIRTNWVTRNKDVLQVTSRSSQPWIENNAALLRIARAAKPDATPTLSYPWTPITVADADVGPALENYLVAIAEAGSFGGNLILPLDERFQKRLLLGDPRARAEWTEIRRHIEFYSWNVARMYRPAANVAIIVADPMRWYEPMNLLLRHNLPFETFTPSASPKLDAGRFDLVIAADPPRAGSRDTLVGFVKGGGTLVLGPNPTPRGRGAAGATADAADAATWPWETSTPVAKSPGRITYTFVAGRVVQMLAPVADPNGFALEIRQLLGADHRSLDIWNGITVLAARFDPVQEGDAVVTVLNYAAQPVPVQLRVRGAYAAVTYESPDDAAALIPTEHRDGYTEFVLPDLRIGARVFLSGKK